MNRVAAPQTKVHPTELYRLSEDKAERKNIAKQHPKVVDQMTQKINQIIARGRITKGHLNQTTPATGKISNG